MRIRLEQEIKELNNAELVEYARAFIEEHKINNPILSAMTKRLSSDPSKRGVLLSSLIAEHNKGKVWEQGASSSSSDSEDNTEGKSKAEDAVAGLETALERISFSEISPKIMNEASFEQLRELLISVFTTAEEEVPSMIKNIVKAMVNNKLIGGVSLSKFDELLDSLVINENEFRPQLHRLAAIYRGQEPGSVFSKGLLRLSIPDEKPGEQDLKAFEKDIKKVIDQFVKVCRGSFKESGVRSSKVKQPVVDDSWRHLDNKSALVEAMENMLTAGYFELTYNRSVYFSVSDEQEGADSVFRSLREPIGVLIDYYNAVERLKNARPQNKESLQKKCDEQLVNFLKFALDTNDPIQTMLCYHFLNPTLLEHIFTLFEKAYDTNDKEFLSLLNKISDKYTHLPNPESQFFNAQIFSFPKVKFTIETGSPLLFCIEAAGNPLFQGKAKELANQGKYLDVLSTSRFPESKGKLPSEFASDIGLHELSAHIKKQTRTHGHSKSSSVVLPATVADQMLAAASPSSGVQGVGAPQKK
jgi:hypothetical protein